MQRRNAFILTAITSDAFLAARCDAAGVDRIGVDIERLYKLDRQRHIQNARISDHELRDLKLLRPAVREAKLFARLNPFHDNTHAEVETALEYGAQVLTLPYFKSAREVEGFLRIVGSRASVSLLLETSEAVGDLTNILDMDGVSDVTVGMNDFSRSLGLANPFELFVSEILDEIAARVRQRGILFGCGGLARTGDANLPIPADLVIAQHPRLGSGAAWLSRSFYGADPAAIDMTAEVAALRERLAHWATQDEEALLVQRETIRRIIGAGSYRR